MYFKVLPNFLTPTGVQPTSNYFVIFQPGSGPLLSHFEIFVWLKIKILNYLGLINTIRIFNWYLPSTKCE